MSKEYASLVYDPSVKHGKYLFSEDLAEKVEKRNKEQRLMKKICVDSFMKGFRPNQTSYTQLRSNQGKGGGQRNTQSRSVRKVVLKRKGGQHRKQSNLPVKDLTQRLCLSVTGHTGWKGIQASQQVLDAIQGYRIVEEPSQCFHPSTKANSAEERDLIFEEINSLLAKDATEEVPMNELCYSSNMFLVARKPGGKRPVLNLWSLNNFIPGIFTKVMKPVVAFIRARGILIIIYLDDILLAAPTFEECNRNTLFVIDLLESLGFHINREKSELIPSHHIPFSGFVIDSVQMLISLPMEKILSIQSMARLLKDSLQTVSLRMSGKFIRMCSATCPAVFQAPAHYRRLQFVKALVYWNSLYPVEASDEEVYLNEKAREDLAWWESRLQFHYSQPINCPPPSKVITSDASNYGWRIWSDGGTLSGSLVRGGDKVAYKSERVDGRFYWPKAIRQMSALPYSHSSSNG